MMRRRLGGLILGLVVIVGVTSVAAGAASKKDMLVGAGKRLNLAGQAVHLQVNAQSGANGEEAGGYYSITRETASGTQSHRGTVYCLTVSGNRANAQAVVEESTAPDIPVGSGFGIQVTDNGAEDTNLGFFGFEPGTFECSIFSDPPEVPIAQGNFVVLDATG
jgi:hypothetical protein